MEEYGISHSNEDNIRLALAPDDRRNAIHLPTAGWPHYRATYGCDPPAPLVDPDLRTAHLFASGSTTTYNRGWGKDIVPSALAAAGAEKVRQEEWQMMDEPGNL